MDIHHNTSLRFILEDDSIRSTSKTCIHFCASKGVGLWLVARPSIHLFHITHFIFISTLCFCLGLIQPLAFNLLTCECGDELDACSMHLFCCPFGGQWIATHNAIWDIMYAHCLKKWTCCMERMVVYLNIWNFIMSQSLHDLRGPSFHCQCGGY
jgi:hypothetical protein